MISHRIHMLDCQVRANLRHYQGNLLKGIDNCSGVALKAVKQLLTTSIGIKKVQF